ncbi:hypothetical protein COHA_002309 [Chlorella ohadii]|uniref:Uncharacterized protein n=1 Tax=Chlorella ohadii TaxID=2649997 RepID=A0AAD5H4N5_9CHLO|nr:hypothetical protein COHA_002309 [Chlorella ohadii]
MAKAAQEFAGLQPMIARYFGSPSKAAGAAATAAQMLAADATAAARPLAPSSAAPNAGTLLFQAAASPPKPAAAPLFVMTKPHPSFAPGTMTMRMQHSSPQK